MLVTGSRDVMISGGGIDIWSLLRRVWQGRKGLNSCLSGHTYDEGKTLVLVVLFDLA